MKETVYILSVVAFVAGALFLMTAYETAHNPVAIPLSKRKDFQVIDTQRVPLQGLLLDNPESYSAVYKKDIFRQRRALPGEVVVIEKPQDIDDVKLEWVMVSGGGNVANIRISGKVYEYRLGDNIRGWNITKIDEEKVVLQWTDKNGSNMIKEIKVGSK